MLYLISWAVIGVLLALWSVAAWAADAILGWTLAHAGSLGTQVPGAAGSELPAWLAPWLGAEPAQWLSSMAAALMQLVQGLLQFAPALADGLSLLVWGAWALGSLLLVALGIAAHMLIAVWLRRRRAHARLPRPYAV
ncbi:hypothetical protein [Uliginosibacterium sp. H1]|uniref:hypothetical protein n=1 Tax=Uliginosibacterium sp. H1 TaxID=3114757 RepID=UPI002E19A0C6|nr:hypothetical protein [Uliginosibacterium sp. H1]